MRRRYHYLLGCVVRGHGGVGHSKLTCLQIVVDWCKADCMEQLGDSGNIVDRWEMSGLHEQ